jgi:hypothetical protein
MLQSIPHVKSAGEAGKMIGAANQLCFPQGIAKATPCSAIRFCNTYDVTSAAFHSAA